MTIVQNIYFCCLCIARKCLLKEGRREIQERDGGASLLLCTEEAHEVIYHCFTSSIHLVNLDYFNENSKFSTSEQQNSILMKCCVADARCVYVHSDMHACVCVCVCTYLCA